MSNLLNVNFSNTLNVSNVSNNPRLVLNWGIINNVSWSRVTREVLSGILPHNRTTSSPSSDLCQHEPLTFTLWLSDRPPVPIWPTTKSTVWIHVIQPLTLVHKPETNTLSNLYFSSTDVSLRPTVYYSNSLVLSSSW